MARERKLASILQKFLEVSDDQQQHFDHAPELSEELDLAKWIEDSREDLDPSPEFMRVSAYRLAKKLREEQKPRARFLPAWKFRLQSRTAIAIALAVVVLFVFINGAVVVNVSQAAIPGDGVYLVKRAVESIRLAAAFSKEADTALYIEQAKLRATEMQYLALEGRYELIPETARAYIRSLNQAIVLLESVHAAQSPLAGELNQQMLDVLSSHKTLSVMLDMVPEEARTEIATTLNASFITSQIAQAIFGK